MPFSETRNLTEADCMRRALALAKRGYGSTSPNPMVGAVLVKSGRMIGQGWHRQAGGPHAEVAALADAARRGQSAAGADLFVTLEPCSTQGRTPPCTEAILRSRIGRVFVGATDPNPLHQGRGLDWLRRAGINVVAGLMAEACADLNRAFNHWIVNRTPYVLVKSAMTLDGKIATASGQSKWITGPAARRLGMRLRRGADAVLVGVSTAIADNPKLTVRDAAGGLARRQPRRIVLDPSGRIPAGLALLKDVHAALTTVVVSGETVARRVRRIAGAARVLVAPTRRMAGRIELDLHWLMARLGAEQVTCLLVEGGGETSARFLLTGLAHEAAFFYAPMVLGGRDARRAVAGTGATSLDQAVRLEAIQWGTAGPDLWLRARLGVRSSPGRGPSVLHKKRG